MREDKGKSIPAEGMGCARVLRQEQAGMLHKQQQPQRPGQLS